MEKILIFELKESDLKILKQYLNDTKLLKFFDNNIVSKKVNDNYKDSEKTFFITLTSEESEKLLDYLSDILIKNGFSKDGNINYDGNNIERLIDIFNYYEN